MKTNRKRWLIDLGNSRLKCAALGEHGGAENLRAIEHGQADPLGALLQHVGSVASGDEAWLASVASAQRTQAVMQALELAGLSVHRIPSQARRGKLRVAYPEPAQLGVDRFLALLAACERDDGPWLVASAGSALTVDLLKADGEHLGGMIAPMPSHMRAALAQNFAQLDLPEGRVRDFADNSADAIATGARTALLGTVEHALLVARARLGVAPTLLISGGAAGLLSAIDYSPKLSTPSLVIDGIACYVRGEEA